MSEDNDSVLGNLPRSRPGVRSDKRASSKRAGGPGATADAPPAPKQAKARTKAAARPRATPRARKPATEPPPPVTQSAIGAALKAGEAVAVTSIKVAGRMAGEVLRRLPRP